jgi:DNA invertase Pin-like site-specific DNA recombinase
MCKRKRKYVIYARQSSSGQDEGSVKRQIQMMRDFMEQDDLYSPGPKIIQYADADDGESQPPTGRI